MKADNHNIKPGWNSFKDLYEYCGKDMTGGSIKYRKCHERLKRELKKGTMLVQKHAWRCNVYDRILLFKTEYVNHVKFHERYEQDTLHLGRGYNACMIWNKICKSLSCLKRYMVMPQTIFQELTQVSSIVITLFDCHLCLKVCKTSTGLTSRLRRHIENTSI